MQLPRKPTGLRQRTWKAVYGNASIVGNDRVVFNIGGYKYRLIVRFDYVHRIGFVRFVGTHAEYDAVDAFNV